MLVALPGNEFLKNNIMKAAEAKKKMESFIRNKSGEFQSIVKDIEKDCGRGRTKTLYRDLSKLTENKLKKLGYSIERSGDIAVISWA